MPAAVRVVIVAVVAVALAVSTTVAASALFTPLRTPVVLAVVAGVTLVHAVIAGVLGSYDLTGGTAWVALVVDHTWSLVNTLFGAVVGNLVYPIFGNLSSAESAGKHWVAYLPRSATGFGTNVLQTLGTTNLGGAGQHERMHLLQARVFGPLYLPLYVVQYIVTGLIQILFTLIVGLAAWKVGSRTAPYLQPPASSAVPGFFGWIYYATPFELWAYGTGNP